MTLRQLRGFLEDPVMQGLRRHLGIYEEEETLMETTLKEDEPFYSEFPVDYELKMTPLWLGLDRVAAGEAASLDRETALKIYKGVYEGLRIKSATPEGAFAQLDKKALSEDILKRADTLSQIMEQMNSAKEIYRAFFVGEQNDEAISADNRLPVMHFDPLRLTVRTADDRGSVIDAHVEIHGQLPWIWIDRAGGCHALVLTGSGKKPGREPEKYILEPVLFWLSCRLTPSGRDRLGGRDITFHVVYKETVKDWTYCVTQDAAVAYLTRLVSDYLNRQRPAWLPFKAVTSLSVKPHLTSDDEIMNEDRETFYTQLREAYSEETSLLVRLAEPQVPENAFDRVRNRFRIFFRYKAQK